MANVEDLTAGELLAAALAEAGVTETPTLEYRFQPCRRWRFDLAFERAKLAIELDGYAAFGAAGRHGRPGGAEGDHEKRNAAVEHGWRVLTYPTSKVRVKKRRARIVWQIKRVLAGEKSTAGAACVLKGG